jgi:drug/metabolite transporter (DMT)-like permease
LKRDSEGPAYLLMLVAVVSWGASFTWLKMALETLPPVGLAAARFSISSLILLCLVLPFPSIRRQLFSRNAWTRFLVIGALGVALPNIVQNYGMLYLGAGISGVVQGAGPIYTGILAALILHEGFGVRKALGAVLAFGGTLLLSLGLNGGGGATATGVGLLTASALSYAVYTVALRMTLLEKMHPFALLAGTTIGGTLPLVALTIIVEPFQRLLSLDHSEWVLLAALVIFPTILGLGCYVGALSRMEASKAAAFIFLVPVIALLLGSVFLGESVSLAQMAFSGLVIGGVAISESERSRRAQRNLA